MSRIMVFGIYACLNYAFIQKVIASLSREHPTLRLPQLKNPFTSGILSFTAYMSISLTPPLADSLKGD